MSLILFTFSPIMITACLTHLISTKGLNCPSVCHYNEAENNASSSFICKSGPDEETIVEEKSVSPELGIATRSFLVNKNRQWYGGVIPYVIGRNFTQTQKIALKGAMRYFRSLSCVRWVPRRTQADYVAIRRPAEKDVCRSVVGRKGGVQYLTLGDMCFNITAGYGGAVEHEIMHAMGFIHEHQRLDRDCYVRVAEEAVRKHPADYVMAEDTSIEFPYDFKSIMHYGTNKAILEPLKGENMGNFDGKLTKLDVMKLNNMYCNGPTYCELNPRTCERLEKAQEKCTLRISPADTESVPLGEQSKKKMLIG